MIVLDASAAVELLLGTPPGARIAQRLVDDADPVQAPHLLDVEVASALRGAVARRLLDAPRAAAALDDLADLAVIRYPHEPLLGRIWELRARLSAYDAAYVALAEALDVPLVTRDARLGRAGGHRARVEVVAS